MRGFRLDAESAGQPVDLVARARAGDLDAFEQIMRLHERQVLGTAVRLVRNAADAQHRARDVSAVVLEYEEAAGRSGATDLAVPGDGESLQRSFPETRADGGAGRCGSRERVARSGIVGARLGA